MGGRRGCPVEAVAGRAWAEVERVRAEAALRESEERFRALAESAPVGIGLGPTDGTILYVNPAIEAMLDYPPGSLAGRPTETIYVHPDERSWVRALARSGRPANRVAQLRRRDGSLVWISSTVAPVTFRGERAVIGVIVYLSERLEAEAAASARETV